MTKTTKMQKIPFLQKTEKTRNIRFSQKCKKSCFLKNGVFWYFRKKAVFSKVPFWVFRRGGQNRESENRGILGG